MSHRRIPRSRRALAATVLLATALIAAVVGVSVSTVPVLIVTTAYAAVIGVVSTRLLANEIAQLRRDWARDRAQQADDFRNVSVARSREQITFAEQMGSRINLRDSQIASLREAIVTAEIELAHARERVSAEKARSQALEADIDVAESDLESARIDLRRASDALAVSESAELQVRAELIAWEQTAADAVRDKHERKLA